MKNKQIFRAWFAAMLTIAFLAGCTEDTGTLGVYPQQDAISTSTASFGVLSNDLLNTVVSANSTACFLGKVIDPETDEVITATFAAQFHSFEGYTFPNRENIVTDDDGYLCDSIEVRLFIKNTFGDKNNPMKVEVWPLSSNEDKLIKESMSLYTNTDLWQHVDESEGPVATKVFTATDYIMSDEQRADKNYADNVRIVLPRQYGENIMETYYSDPNAFRDSYSFIRKVCAGFLFRTVGGTGTMLNLEVCTMNLYFKFKSEAYPDSIMSANCRFAATPEVIQSTQFESSNLAGLIGNEQYTMLKTPAGICTELVLPIDEIYNGHENDSIARASFTLARINNQDEDALNDDYALGIPQNLLLVRKQHLTSFFEEHQVSDSQQSFTTYFQDIYNCYTFGNISRLISYCHNEKAESMKAEISEYKKECKKKYDEDPSERREAIKEVIETLKKELDDTSNNIIEALVILDDEDKLKTHLEKLAQELGYPNLFEMIWEKVYKPKWPMVWNTRHSDWNHVVLVPVTIATASDSYGNSVQVSVTHDLSLCSTKIVRGTETNPIKMQVIYSRFADK